MKSIIIAAGKATRLLPLTKDTPQCLLKINGKTILEYQVDTLKEGGIDDIEVICGHMVDKVENFCKEIEVKTIFNPFYDISGMAMTLWVARERIKDGFIFLYSDIIFDATIIKGLLLNKEDICLAIKKSNLREEAEKVIESNGIIKNVSKQESDKENGEFVGIAKFSATGVQKLLDELDSIAKSDINTSFIQIVDNLIKKGEIITAYDIKTSKFVDIDFIEDLEKAKIQLKKDN